MISIERMHRWYRSGFPSPPPVSMRFGSPIVPEVVTFDLVAANQALMELKNKQIRGAKVLVMDQG